MRTNRNMVVCPKCGKPTVLNLLPTTEVKDLGFWCKKCNQRSLLNIPRVPVP